MPDQDEELIQRARQSPEGDLRAFEEFVRKYQRRIVANCRHIIHDPNNAEDLAQEVFVKAFFALRSFEGRSSARHWLQTIKVNHCLNHLKKERRAVMFDIEEQEDWTPAAEVPRRNEDGSGLLAERQIIERVLDAMSPTLRLPLILCDMDEFSYDEIAQFLGVGLSAVKMRIKRARQEFRERYELELQTDRQAQARI